MSAGVILRKLPQRFAQSRFTKGVYASSVRARVLGLLSGGDVVLGSLKFGDEDDTLSLLMQVPLTGWAVTAPLQPFVFSHRAEVAAPACATAIVRLRRV